MEKGQVSHQSSWPLFVFESFKCTSLLNICNSHKVMLCTKYIARECPPLSPPVERMPSDEAYSVYSLELLEAGTGTKSPG